jgi:cytochrome c peroxidase
MELLEASVSIRLSSVRLWRCVVAGLLFVPVDPTRCELPIQLPERLAGVLLEPITPIPTPPATDPLKRELGARLFHDRRLSRDNDRACATCHDIDTNGTSAGHALADRDGSAAYIDIPTVFNAALNFRLDWEGSYRTLAAQAAASLTSPRTLNLGPEAAAAKLQLDPDTVERFRAAYGQGPDAGTLVDAIATFEQTLLTPGSRFDRWLAGDLGALSMQELAGYRLFKSLGCVSCHQGVNVGGNLFQRHGVFRSRARTEPRVLRVPSLRNVAETPPYFRDGSAATLEDAVRRMGAAQLNSDLTDAEVGSVVAFLRTLTGTYQGRSVGAPR